MRSLEDLASDLKFTQAKTGVDRTVTFLPEPPRAERRYLVISADDHIVEPPDTFVGRIPSHLVDRAPRIVEDDEGRQAWVYDGQELPNIGFNAVVGRPVSEYGFEPVRFEDMRRGAWDIEARVAEMDINGVYASLCFPSFLPGFAGQRLQLLTKDTELALATTRAWNDWHLDAWCGAHPDRMIPCQLPWLLDPVRGATMIRENAARGFKSVTFPENPTGHGLPSIHSGHWDPFIEACVETETVINLHIGSSGASPTTTDDAPPDVTGVLFFGYAMFAAVDHMLGYHEMYGTWTSDLKPSEVMQRNFWFCAVEDPSSFDQRERIGIDHIMLESDYPHCDSTWPRTQSVIEKEIGHLPASDIQKITWQNAAALYRHPVPEAVQRDVNAY
jgi:predicted TIM-barrel fold metal-dependent hydrolase